MTATFTAPNGAAPAEHIRQIQLALVPAESALLYALERQKTRILQRTAAGVDADGNAFTPYSAAYAKRKSKYRDPSTVDLRGRNAPHMLQDIHSEITGPNEIALRIYSERDAVIARAHNEGDGRMPRRHWFDVDEAGQDIAAMEQDIGQAIEANLKGLL
jgi:hypothetical protein